MWNNDSLFQRFTKLERAAPRFEPKTPFPKFGKFPQCGVMKKRGHNWFFKNLRESQRESQLTQAKGRQHSRQGYVQDRGLLRRGLGLPLDRAHRRHRHENSHKDTGGVSSERAGEKKTKSVATQVTARRAQADLDKVQSAPRTMSTSRNTWLGQHTLNTSKVSQQSLQDTLSKPESDSIRGDSRKRDARTRGRTG